MEAQKLLEVEGLKVGFESDGEFLVAVDGISFSLQKGKTLGLVGESGCGKSVTALSLLQLLPQPMGKIIEGEIIFQGKNLLEMDSKSLSKIRGNEISYIFQEPMTALNPVHRIGRQLSEAVLIHQNMGKEGAWARAIELLDQVGIPSPENRMMEYPHQLSGGMRQRVGIAIALANNPKILIADEPTTALDVTVQAQILDLLKRLQRENEMALFLITHDLGVIAEMCDVVAVMYAGRLVERAPVADLFHKPLHAYTQGLINSIPRLDGTPKTLLPHIPGNVPSLRNLKQGCRFADRSQRAHTEAQKKNRPDFKEIIPNANHWVEACPVCAS